MLLARHILAIATANRVDRDATPPLSIGNLPTYGEQHSLDVGRTQFPIPNDVVCNPISKQRELSCCHKLLTGCLAGGSKFLSLSR